MAVHPEALLISAIIKTGEYQHLAAQGISSAMFHACEDEMQWLESYIARSSKTPSKAAMKQQFPEFVLYKVDDTAHWCEEVRKAHKRQSLVDLMDEALTMIDSEDEDMAMDTITKGLSTITLTSGGVRPDFDLFEEWESIYDEVKERVTRVRTRGQAGIPTGFATLDHVTGGFQPGWFAVIAARLGQGKTWTGIRSAWAAASAGYRVTYFSLEQSKFQIATRVHAFGSRQYAKAAFNPLDLNKGTGFDLRDYRKFLEELKSHKKPNGEFYINDTSRGGVTPATIAGVIESKQPDIVYIDYLTLMGQKGDDWRGTRDMSAEIQSITQRFMVPIVGLSQVNRMGAGKNPPSADNLSQADAIGQDADLVLTMAQQSKRVQKFRLAKFRHGPGGDVMWYAKFSPGTGEYEEISGDDAADLIEEDGEDD